MINHIEIRDDLVPHVPADGSNPVDAHGRLLLGSGLAADLRQDQTCATVLDQRVL